MMSAKPQFRNFKADIRGAAKPLIGLVVFAVIAIRLLASAFGSDGVSLDVAQTGWREVQLTWSEHDEAVRYRIYYIVPPSSEPILEDSIEREYTGMTYDIVHDGRYCFWIEAVISSDEVEKSNEECVTVE